MVARLQFGEEVGADADKAFAGALESFLVQNSEGQAAECWVDERRRCNGVYSDYGKFRVSISSVRNYLSYKAVSKLD